MMIVKNPGEPIRLENVQFDGFAGSAARPGETVKLIIRGAYTSDEPEFHKLTEGFGGALLHMLQLAGRPEDLRRANLVLLVIKPDNSANLWIDNVAVSHSVVLRRPVSEGSAVFESDIVDVTRMSFPDVVFEPSDKALCLFRESWRFGFVFNFNPEKAFSLPDFELTLGTCYRNLRYKHIYDTIANEALYSGLVSNGWFPFAELIGQDYKKLVGWMEAGLDFRLVEAELISSFKGKRSDDLIGRWMSRPLLKSREALLRSAIDAFQRGDSISVIKILLSEIEGILRQAYTEQNSPTRRIDILLQHIAAVAERKAGTSASLLLPIEFVKFMKKSTFAEFDLNSGIGTASSRHAVNHGAADPNSYTEVRALQAILTVDQIAFYL